MRFSNGTVSVLLLAATTTFIVASTEAEDDFVSSVEPIGIAPTTPNHDKRRDDDHQHVDAGILSPKSFPAPIGLSSGGEGSTNYHSSEVDARVSSMRRRVLQTTTSPSSSSSTGEEEHHAGGKIYLLDL
jgi:hypothetical protein